MGAKHNDILGAWSCHHCHDLVDGRMPDATISTTMRRLYHLTGIVRTQDILIAEGKIRAKST
jgi:hypothetical protein